MTQVTVRIERKADFWWVCENDRPSFPCETLTEAKEIAVLLGGTPAAPKSIHDVARAAWQKVVVDHDAFYDAKRHESAFCACGHLAASHGPLGCEGGEGGAAGYCYCKKAGAR